MVYRKCERCGANLDPGEKCDCGRQGRHDTYSDKERVEVKNACNAKTEKDNGQTPVR